MPPIAKKKLTFHELHYRFFKWLVRYFCIPLHCAKRKYLDPSLKKAGGSYIIISNHTSMIDPVVLFYTFPKMRIRFLCAKELYSVNFALKHFLPFIGGIRVDRECVDTGTAAEISAALAENNAVGIFPEGRIEQSAELYPFKPGMVLFAMMNDVPVIPVYIERKKTRFSQRRMVIGEKICFQREVKMPTVEHINAMTEMIYDKVCELRSLV